jgi:hypothetical protein
MQTQIHGTLSEQLDRANRDIAQCEKNILDPDYPDNQRMGLWMGWADARVNRDRIILEMVMEATQAA